MHCRNVVIKVAIAAVMLLATHASVAHAATISKLHQHYCDALLQGPIEDGDNVRLKEILNDLPAIIENEGRDQRLCLDSEGGSYTEAIRIIKGLASSSANTIVYKGHSCFSACALVFLFGNHNEGDLMESSHRELHAGGRLGFHTPHISANVEAKSQTILSKAYREGIKAIGQLLEADWDDRVPKNLLIDMLKVEPDQALFADTIGKIASWDIEFVGYKKPKKLTNRMLEWACLNHTRAPRFKWSSRWFGYPDFGQTSQPEFGDDNPIKLVNGKHRSIFKNFGQENTYSCAVDVVADGAGELFIAISMDSNEESFLDKNYLQQAIKSGNSRIAHPIWLAYPADTALQDLVE